MSDDKVKLKDLKMSLKSIKEKDNNFEIIVRLSNEAQRSLHYVSDVRAVRYDASTKRLSVCLSDDGREVIPGVASLLPVFRHVAPGDTAEILLTVPTRLVKLIQSVPPGKLEFESHDLTLVDEVFVEMAWSDVPYYPDTRNNDDTRLPSCQWQQFKSEIKKSMKRKKK